MDRLKVPSSDFVFARAISLVGFGGRRSGEYLVVEANGVTQGSLFGGVTDAEIRARAEEMFDRRARVGIFSVDIGDGDAVKAGLACGGRAEILVNSGDALPDGFIVRLARREPNALASVVEGGAEGLALALDVSGVLSIPLGSELDRKNPMISQVSVALEERLGRRISSCSTEEFGDTRVVLEVFSPPTEMTVVGTSHLANAIIAQANLLGWSGQVVDVTSEALDAVLAAGANDALVVLTHDHDIGIPVISEALKAHPMMYIGALGSRHTQEARDELLSQQGFDAGQRERIHGPVGLDLGARTPEETALAICAEVLAHISGRSAGSLKASSGPING